MCRSLGILSVVLPDAVRVTTLGTCLHPNSFSPPSVVLPRNALRVGTLEACVHTLVVHPLSFLADKHIRSQV
jgi:hypothetical protein